MFNVSDYIVFTAFVIGFLVSVYFADIAFDHVGIMVVSIVFTLLIRTMSFVKIPSALHYEHD